MSAQPTELNAPFRELFELSPDPIMLFDEGIITHANHAAIKLLRAESMSQLVGMNSRDLIHADSHHTVERNAAALLRGEVTSTRAEEMYVRLDGTLVAVESNAALATFLGRKAFIVIARDITTRKEEEEHARRAREAQTRAAAAQERERWLRNILDLLPVIVFARDAQGAYVLANRKCSEALGEPEPDLDGERGKGVPVGHAFSEQASDEDARALASDEPIVLPEREVIDRRGRKRILEGVKVRIRFGEGFAVLGILNDLTERRELEAGLMRAQRLEGIGRLAGGIAHDFNNLLGVILAFAGGLAETFDERDGRREDVLQIQQAGERAASLTRQLLAFARRQPVAPRVIDLGAHLTSMEQLFRRVIREDITFAVEAEAGLHVRVDVGQLEQVVMNLSMNARDAMPDGGSLAVRACKCDATHIPLSKRGEMGPGPFALFTVKDTGPGLSKEVREHLFEPFFTTKDVGRGTGLGLATCYGIVQNAGGAIWAESNDGEGATFHVCLPLSAEGPPPATAPAPRSSAAGKGEVILVAEDDDGLRKVVARVLTQRGYQILVANDGTSALALGASAERIDLLLSDVVMPGMRGPDLARELRARRPSLKVLFMSGYTGDAAGIAADRLLSKPFTPDTLARRVRAALDE